MVHWFIEGIAMMLVEVHRARTIVVAGESEYVVIIIDKSTEMDSSQHQRGHKFSCLRILGTVIK